MKVIDVILEEPLNRTVRGGRDDSTAAGVAGGAAATGVVVAKNADKIPGVKRGVKVAGRFIRKYRGDAILTKALARVLPQALKQGALKSIPLAGIIISGYFAGQQLAKGSITGAAIEIASSLGSAWTSIPATIWIITRDMYDQMYQDPDNPDAFVSVEEDLIRDPEGTKERLNFLKRVITKVVTDNLESVQKWASTKKDQQEPSSARKEYEEHRRRVLGGN